MGLKKGGGAASKLCAPQMFDDFTGSRGASCSQPVAMSCLFPISCIECTWKSWTTIVENIELLQLL